MFDFSHRVVMVAGASGNLGRAVAQAFLAAGASLALLDRAPDRLPSLFPELAGSPDHLLLGAVDANNADQVQQAVQATLTRLGRLDVLANTIGGWQGGTPVHETSPATWDAMFNLNARPAFILSRAVAPAMLVQGAGRIIHTAARAALAGSGKGAAYSAAKSAVVRLVESLAAELRDKKITVNCVLPGTIDTPQNRAAMPHADPGRWVPPEAIAHLFLFLASDAAWPISGAAIPVYGRS